MKKCKYFIVILIVFFAIPNHSFSQQEQCHSTSLGKAFAESWIRVVEMSQKREMIFDLAIKHKFPNEALNDWSYEFLMDAERNIFGKLRGGRKTSLSKELNSIIEIDNFYENLNQREKRLFEEIFISLSANSVNNWNMNRRIIFDLLNQTL